MERADDGSFKYDLLRLEKVYIGFFIINKLNACFEILLNSLKKEKKKSTVKFV